MNIEHTVILDLAEADCNGIGNKARNLARLIARNPYLFSVPPGLVLQPGFSVEQHAADLIDALHPLHPSGDGLFAVRSCGQEEDGASESMAGKFHTELFIPIEGMTDAINSVRASFGDSLDTGAVLIQKMIEPDYAGVLFTRSPENYGFASCEYSEGIADDLVSGKVSPKHVDYGRWTGNLYPDPEKKEMNQMLSLVFLVGMIIETRMGHPQDIEWAYDAKKEKLYILQSRNITSYLYDQSVAEEQEKAATIAAASKAGKKGNVVFQNAAVREVVLSPTRLTRSLVEQLYTPAGSLGKALELLDLPCSRIDHPYVLSVFGQLYENKEVGKKLFGFHPRRIWANRRLKKKVVNDPKGLQKWITEKIENFPQHPDGIANSNAPADEYARTVIRGMRTFTEEVYPVSYAATLLAQLSGEDTSEASLTSQMMRDLSRLHHTGEMDEFLQKWGLRSANDYELSEPRFCESAEHALLYAEKFANFSWEEVECGSGFTHLKEVGKDRAIRWLYPLRQQIVALEQKLCLQAGMIFHLDLADIEALATGKTAAEDVAALCEKHVHAEAQWAGVSPGDELTLEILERLEKQDQKQEGLLGKMVSTKVAFKGVARHVASMQEQHVENAKMNGAINDLVIIAQHLEPELVGLFPHSAGCVVDMGGGLSHAAIVARELDFPILVLSGCSSTVHDGDLIEVSIDGAITITRQH